MAENPHPTEIKLRKSARELVVTFDDGKMFALPFEYLRVFSPSAEVRGHGGPMMLVINKQDVEITRIEPVGNYAVRLVFDDGHDSGLYSWKLLYELGRDRAANWADYLERTSRVGKGRPAG